MKEFESYKFNLVTYKEELEAFKQLLTKPNLEESKDILPFFKEKKHLVAQIGTLVPDMQTPDKIAYEFDIFGDFKSDCVVGDSKGQNYCFIEFEDANEKSVFVQKKGKYKPEFSPRFEHGFSQIVDWFYKLDGLHFRDFKERFGSSEINYHGILIIGRNNYLDESLRERLKWRTNHVIINSKQIHCYTFDDLYERLNRKLQYTSQ
ncbi:MAG: DUF4263 domain-containing protein [Chitinophagales bacterium]|jgi:hypothetical protein|nr:DUF4263 domain-containing protein [Sphingobacteriales bacterium]MBP6665089.1 DUF4263 domain-containing protein [Chitinophagales bacterium]MBP7534605.1 DUF4263 domain-containing protein [Chitinophagales bacterium]